MIYGSICSGIEAATVAWHPLSWRPAFFSEIDAFPRAVLAHHYPAVPLHGDFTTIEAGQYAAIDVLVGGTPCQSFSIAGLRAGLADARGNLALEFCLLARRLRPKWVVWENVPGVLSLDGGRAFASILGGLAECGYGLAYRVLDAQFVRVDGFGRAVPQRRRRVFVVGCLGDWRSAAAVLFERQSLSWDTPPRRWAGTGVAASLTSSTGGSSGKDAPGRIVALNDLSGAAHALTATATATGHLDPTTQDLLGVAHALRGDGFDASEDGTGRGTPLVSVGVALRGRDGGATAELTGDVMTSMRTGGGGGDKPHVLAPIAYRTTGNDGAYETGPITDALTTGTDRAAISLLQSWRVRRLMPIECERLQGFSDDYTDVPYRGKRAADGPRYKALGNSMAVNVMRWIGTRIAHVESIPTTRAA
jgi:DNA (cytosine-5)-methyltransferase 1